MEINYKCIWKFPIIFTLHQTCLRPQHSVLQNLHQWSPPVHHSLHVSISVTSPGLDYNRLLITPLQSTVGKLMFKWTIILQYWQFQEGQKKVFFGIKHQPSRLTFSNQRYLHQIFINFEIQRHFQNLLVWRFLKHTLHVQFECLFNEKFQVEVQPNFCFRFLSKMKLQCP